MQQPGEIPVARFGRPESGKVAEDFLLAAWRQRDPCRPGLPVLRQRDAEPRRRGVHGAAAIGGIENESDADGVSDAGVRRFADRSPQVEVEAAVAAGHHVDAPGRLRFAIDLHKNRHRAAPALFQGAGPFCADEYVRVEDIDAHERAESQRSHGDILREKGAGRAVKWQR
jgi:hypothetical protein